jgi:hypothetical protein
MVMIFESQGPFGGHGKLGGRMMIRLFGTIVLVLGLLPSFCGTPAQAHIVDFDKPNGTPAILGQKAVQEELKLSAEDVKTVSEIASGYRKKLSQLNASAKEKDKNLTADERKEKADERLAALNAAHQPLLNEANSKLKEILSPTQMKRYRQISLWFSLPYTWKFPDAESLLNLNDEQKAKIRGFIEAHVARLRGFSAIVSKITDRKVASEQNRFLRKESGEQATKNALAILDEGQKATWKEMLGEPFSLDR